MLVRNQRDTYTYIYNRIRRGCTVETELISIMAGNYLPQMFETYTVFRKTRNTRRDTEKIAYRTREVRFKIKAEISLLYVRAISACFN